MNNWLFNDAEVTEESIPELAIGFVYIITNIQSSRKYIGKKNIYKNKISVKTVVIKSGPNAGTKKKKKTKIPVFSDWENYYGSSAELTEEISKLGKENYLREITRFCNTKSELSYYESKEIFVRDALLSNDYYNSWISCRIRKDHLKNCL
jgi:hypothetical protein